MQTDDVHKALTHPDRRHLLAALKETDQPIDLNEPDIDGVAADHMPVRVKFRHLHLPLLEHHDFVAWNKEDGEVSQGKNFDVLRPWLGDDGDVVHPPRNEKTRL